MIAIEGGVDGAVASIAAQEVRLDFSGAGKRWDVCTRSRESTQTGLLNLITDVVGLHVGNADDARLRSGVTAVLFDQPAVAAVDVRGGGPGSRETDLLAPENTVQMIDALVLSGGSAFGLDAAGGVQARLREQGRGFAVRSARVPIVPAATLFDLLNGGDKQWGVFSPYRDFGNSC
jgi:L-aminopeptidase/D-esterase-like protein